MRLDRYLTASRMGSRSEVKNMIRKGSVSVNGITVKDPSVNIKTDDDVTANGRKVLYREHFYYMLNKPAGYLSATEDNADRTVLDLFPAGLRKGLFPVGRLDKDSVGLLIITDDGAMAHKLMSPKNHIAKSYLIHTDIPLSKEDSCAFSEGIVLSDGTKYRSAALEISADDPTRAVVTITEGKYHQVKRMTERCGKKVLYLKRLSVGELKLDPDLQEGMFRELTSDEIEMLSK